MRIPKTVKIGGHTVTVSFKDLEGRYDGLASTEDNTIVISTKLTQSQKEVTLIHEAMHMMNATWAETREGHIFLESLSQQMYQFLADNHLLKN